MKDNVEIAQDYTDWLVKTGGYAKDMTLRDHFAGLAMQATVNAWIINRIYPLSDLDVANNAYVVADAMLEERNHVKKKDIEENKLHSMEIDELAMTMRPINCLRANGIKTLGDLLKKTRWDLMKFPNLGKKSILEIEEVLADLHLKLRGM